MSFPVGAAPMHNFPGQDLDFTQYPKHTSNLSYDKIWNKLLCYSLLLWTIWKSWPEQAAEEQTIPATSFWDSAPHSSQYIYKQSSHSLLKQI